MEPLGGAFEEVGGTEVRGGQTTGDGGGVFKGVGVCVPPPPPPKKLTSQSESSMEQSRRDLEGGAVSYR